MRKTTDKSQPEATDNDEYADWLRVIRDAFNAIADEAADEAAPLLEPWHSWRKSGEQFQECQADAWGQPTAWDPWDCEEIKLRVFGSDYMPKGNFKQIHIAQKDTETPFGIGEDATSNLLTIDFTRKLGQGTSKVVFAGDIEGDPVAVSISKGENGTNSLVKAALAEKSVLQAMASAGLVESVPQLHGFMHLIQTPYPRDASFRKKKSPSCESKNWVTWEVLATDLGSGDLKQLATVLSQHRPAIRAKVVHALLSKLLSITKEFHKAYSHGDMKAANIIYTDTSVTPIEDVTPDELVSHVSADTFKLKLIDFGSVVPNSAGDAPVGPPSYPYASPEAMTSWLHKTTVSTATRHQADMWGVGVVIYYLLTFKKAFKLTTPRRLPAGVVKWSQLPREADPWHPKNWQLSIQNVDDATIMNNLKKDPVNIVPNWARYVILHCLQVDASKRPTAAQLSDGRHVTVM